MRFLTIALAGLTLAWAADKKLPIEKNSNELVEIDANVFIDRDQIKHELGADPGPGIVVVRVRVRPLIDKPYKIDRDQFYLLSDKDGQRSNPYAPSQIAGSAALVLKPVQTQTIGIQNNGPVWGGVGGGMPARLPGNGTAAGSGTAGSSRVEATAQTDNKGKDNTVLAVLKDKVLPEKEITEPITGYLYFGMDGKLKPKNLELYYKTTAGRMGLRFQP